MSEKIVQLNEEIIKGQLKVSFETAVIEMVCIFARIMYNKKWYTQWYRYPNPTGDKLTEFFRTVERKNWLDFDGVSFSEGGHYTDAFHLLPEVRRDQQRQPAAGGHGEAAPGGSGSAGVWRVARGGSGDAVRSNGSCRSLHALRLFCSQT